jgi:hypothetical protein
MSMGPLFWRQHATVDELWDIKNVEGSVVLEIAGQGRQAVEN